MNKVALLFLVAASILLSGCNKEKEMALMCLIPQQEQARVTYEQTQCLRYEGENCAVAIQVRLLKPEIAVDAVSAGLRPNEIVTVLTGLYQQFFTPSTRRR